MHYQPTSVLAYLVDDGVLAAADLLINVEVVHFPINSKL
jgi:hypothetical protein